MPQSVLRKQRWPRPGAKVGGVCRLELVKEIFPEWKLQKQNSWIALLPLQLKRCPVTWHGGVLGMWAPWGKGHHRQPQAQCQVQSHEQSTWWSWRRPPDSPQCWAYPHTSNCQEVTCEWQEYLSSKVSAIHIASFHLHNDYVTMWSGYYHCPTVCR